MFKANMFLAVVSRAFQILSDADKKARYDKFGGDPDSRSAPSASTSSPFSGFSGAQRDAARGGGMWEEEISPEEMFRQFFGGGGMGGFGGPFGTSCHVQSCSRKSQLTRFLRTGGGLFDTGPQFVFNMGGGGPGIRVHQFGGNRPRRRPHNHEAAAQPPSAISALQSLLPLLLLFLLPLLSSLFSSSAPSGPNMRFDAAVPPHTLQHVSQRLKVPYWVVPSEVSDYTSKKWRDLDRVAEGKYVGQLNTECELEQQRRQRLYQEAQGFFWTDNEKLNQARAMEMRSCKRLGELGYRV